MNLNHSITQLRITAGTVKRRSRTVHMHFIRFNRILTASHYRSIIRQSNIPQIRHGIRSIYRVLSNRNTIIPMALNTRICCPEVIEGGSGSIRTRTA
nr:hypothetical protein Itr_chr09CG01420 [Ipomoea trifida]